MKKIIDRFSTVFANEGFLVASVAATLALFAVNLIAKLLCGLYKPLQQGIATPCRIWCKRSRL